MSILSVSYNNFKNNLKTYTGFFVSMIFSVVILSNFELLRYGETIQLLSNENKKFTQSILTATMIVFIVFIFFFIGYATNIFLRNRMKEMGILYFMGLDSLRIGKIYFVETILMGISSYIIGILRCF